MKGFYIIVKHKDFNSFDPFNFVRISIIIIFFIFELRVELEKTMTCLLSFMCCFWVELGLKPRIYDPRSGVFSHIHPFGTLETGSCVNKHVLLPNRVIITVK